MNLKASDGTTILFSAEALSKMSIGRLKAFRTAVYHLSAEFYCGDPCGCFIVHEGDTEHPRTKRYNLYTQNIALINSVLGAKQKENNVKEMKSTLGYSRVSSAAYQRRR